MQRRVAAGVISAGHARALLAIEDPASQERLAQRVVAEGLSVRAVEELVTVGEAADRLLGDRVSRRWSHRKSKISPTGSDHFDTRVRVALGRTKGRIVIEFATVDDLERIVALIEKQPEEAEQYRQSDIQEKWRSCRRLGASA